MSQLLPILSLPQRLSNCIFQPLVLTLLLSTLLTIWTSYALLLSRTVVDNPGPPIASTMTVTSIVATAAATTASATVMLKDAYSVNTSAVRGIAEAYLEQRKSSIADFVNTLSSQTYHEWQESVVRWNESFNQILSTEMSNCQHLMSLKDVVRSQLYAQSARVNESLDRLSQTTLTVGNIDAQDLLANLSVNFWFVEELFAAVPQQIVAIEKFPDELMLPTISYSSVPFASFNISDTINSTFDRLTKAFLEIQTAENATLVLNSSSNLRKRSAEYTQREGIDQLLYKRCQILSLIVSLCYLVTVALLGVFEWLTYTWEVYIFNFHMANMLERCETEYERGSNKIKLQQELRSFTKKLRFSINQIVVYHFSNWVDVKKVGSEASWRRLVSYIWWIWSSGKNLWTLLFYVLLQWQILMSMVHITHTSSESSTSHMTPSKRRDVQTSPPVVTNFASDTTWNYCAAIKACDDFEAEVTSLLITSAAADFDGVLVEQVNDINSKMNSLTNKITIVTPNQWSNLTFRSILDTPMPNPEDRLSYKILEQAVEHSVIVQASAENHPSQFLRSREGNHHTANYVAASWRHMYKWAFIALLTTLAIHHLFGFLVVARL